MLNKIISGVCAGLVITIGGAVFLSCDNRYVGAVMFSVALLCICYKGYSLFTGKIGFIPEKHGREEISVLLLGLLGNVVGTAAGGYGVRCALPRVGAAAEAACAARLEQTLPQTLLRAVFCGILMYLAVSIFRDRQTPIGILFCIPVFILCGFEHSIADMFYFAAANSLSLRACGFIAAVLAGNAVGGVLLPLLSMTGGKRHEP